MRTASALVYLALAYPAAAQLPKATATDSPVWASVLAAVYPDSVRVTIADSTVSLERAPRSATRWLPWSSVDDTAAFNDMLDRNRQAFLITSAVRDSLASAPRSRAGGPQRFVRFARPGFNARHDVAFVYGQFTCGLMCNWDEGFVLELHNGAWVVVARRRYSVS